ncbi:nucleotidyltransferase family protein [Metabacillus sp. YM-086]|uniref:nucleotidyltransferase family protein n=1 Tax=Metabacillus TaxID=2675233 RepID=UPI002040B2D3|nr:nucleotidyltransferase family protein [Metabacillus litoralis]MCM3409715.1 nucleotidyltransferase family protein [Metabacillus litoralis]
MNEKEIISIVQQDKWMMEILKSVRMLGLPDWWICAGFIRSKIWDTLHHFNERTRLPDVDVIYFDSTNINEVEEKMLEEKLKTIMADVPWSVKNEARMHLKSNLPPYLSSVDAISKFPETATSLGLKLDEKGHIKLIAPHGINDVVNLEVKPTPFFLESKERVEVYEDRIAKKNWRSIWFNLKIHHIRND